MELRHLRYFISVADDLSFTQAAKKLRLAQPSLTRQIHNLEEELGVRLLTRAKNRVSLTEEGRSFLTDARQLVAQSVASIQSVKRLSRGETSHLNLGYMSKFNFDILPGALVEFGRVCPETAVNLFDMTPAEQLRRLESRKIDLGFVGLRPPAAAQLNAALKWDCVAHHEVVMALPAGHPLASQSKISILDLKPLFFVGMSETTHPGSHAWLAEVCQLRAGFTPKVLQEVELESDLMAFVANGLGVALARGQIKNLAPPGVVFRVPAERIMAELWIAWHPANLSKALLKCVEIVKAQAALAP